MDNHIIILGGMGPQASLRLHEHILLKSRNTHAGGPHEYPAILHASMQIPDFISNPKNVPHAVQIIQKTLQQLPSHEAVVIGIACNTAHLLLDDIGMNNFTNFVSMIDAVVMHTQKQGLTKIGLLASPHTIHSKIYQNAFNRVNIELVLPTLEDIKQIDSIIRQVIAGSNDVVTQQTLTTIASRLIDKGSRAILLGCTELPIVGLNTCSVPVIDSLSVLADAMVSKSNLINV